MVAKTLADEWRDFYVYVIFRPNGVPCYVGKGRCGRWQQHIKNSHNRWLRNIYNKANGDLPISKIREGLTNADACATEIALIGAIGREIDGGPLVNITAGGEGLLGHTPFRDEAWRERQRLAHIGQTPSPEARAKMSATRKGRKLSAKHVESLRKANAGRKPSQAMMDAFQVWCQSEEGKRRQAERNAGNKYGIGNKRTPEGQARVTAAVSANNRRRVATPEYKETRRQIAKAMWANRSAEERSAWYAKIRGAAK